MKYIVYQTVNKINRKIYIGVHGTDDPNVFDGYIGCGCYVQRPASYKNPKTPFQYSVHKYGVKNFIRTTIQCFDLEEDAYKLEALLVNEDFIRREDTYNVNLGGKEGGAGWSHCRVNVYMYNLDGDFEKEFNSLKEASLFLKSKNTGHLCRAIKQGHQYLGHQFSYEKVPCMKKLRCRKLTTVDLPYIGKKVGRFDNNGNLIEIYQTMTDCVKAGYKNAKQVALNKRSHCKGFIFKYLD